MVLAGTLLSDPADPSPLFCPNELFLISVVAVLRGESRVTGEVQFEQASEEAPVKVTYNITGMDPSSKRGFHVQ